MVSVIWDLPLPDLQWQGGNMFLLDGVISGAQGTPQWMGPPKCDGSHFLVQGSSWTRLCDQRRVGEERWWWWNYSSATSGQLKLLWEKPRFQMCFKSTSRWGTGWVWVLESLPRHWPTQAKGIAGKITLHLPAWPLYPASPTMWGLLSIKCWVSFLAPACSVQGILIAMLAQNLCGAVFLQVTKLFWKALMAAGQKCILYN